MDWFYIIILFTKAYSGVLSILGVCQLIVCVKIFQLSKSEQYGGIYFALTSILTGFGGIIFSKVSDASWLIIGCVINIIASLAGLALSSSVRVQLMDINACSQYTPSWNSTSCVVAQLNENLSMQSISKNSTKYALSDFSCVGRAAYFTSAVVCNADKVSAGSASTSNCMCVTDTEVGSPCFTFGGYESCDAVLHELPVLFYGSYYIAILCLFFCALLVLTLCCAAQCMPKDMQISLSRYQRDARSFAAVAPYKMTVAEITIPPPLVEVVIDRGDEKEDDEPEGCDAVVAFDSELRGAEQPQPSPVKSGPAFPSKPLRFDPNLTAATPVVAVLSGDGVPVAERDTTYSPPPQQLVYTYSRITTGQPIENEDPEE